MENMMNLKRLFLPIAACVLLTCTAMPVYAAQTPVYSIESSDLANLTAGCAAAPTYPGVFIVKDTGYTYRCASGVLTRMDLGAVGDVASLNGIDFLNRQATAGDGTAGDPWTGWAPFLAAASDSLVFVPPGYYQAPDSTTDLPDGLHLSCTGGATFQWSATRTASFDLFSITGTDADVTIDGCTFAPGITVPNLGITDCQTDSNLCGYDYIRVGSASSSSGPGTVIIRNNVFGPTRFPDITEIAAMPANNNRFGESIKFYSVRDLVIDGNTFDAATDNIGARGSHPTYTYTSKSIRITNNSFDWKLDAHSQIGLGPIAFGPSTPSGNDQHADTVLISNNTLNNFQGSLFYQPFDIDSLTIANNIANSDSMDFCILAGPPSATAFVDRMSVIGNHCTAPTGQSAKISVGDFTSAYVAGNTVESGVVGASITASSTVAGSSVVFAGNTVINVDGTNGTSDGFSVLADNVVARDNTAVDTQELIGTSGTYKSWIVTNNTLVETGGEVVTMVCPATSDWASLTNNFIDNTTPANGSFSLTNCDQHYGNRVIGGTYTENEFQIAPVDEKLLLKSDIEINTGGNTNPAEFTLKNPAGLGGTESSFFQLLASTHGVEHELVRFAFNFKNVISGNTLESWNLTTDAKTVYGGVEYGPIYTGTHDSDVTTVRAYDYDADGVLEMTDLDALLDLYGSNTHLVVPAGDWIAQPDEADTTYILGGVGLSNVTIDCENGAVLHGNRRYGGQHTPAGSSATVLTDSTASMPVDELIGYTLVNWTDGSYCTVTDNDETTITCSALTAGVVGDCTSLDSPYAGCTGVGAGSGLGADLDWDQNDYYGAYIDNLHTVYFSTSTNISVLGCEIDAGLPDAANNSDIVNGMYAIQPGKGLSFIGSERVRVKDVYCHDSSHSCIYGDQSDDVLVTDFIVERTGRWTPSSRMSWDSSNPQNGIQFYTAGTGDGVSGSFVISDGIIRNVTSNSITFRKETSAELVERVVVSDVLIENDEMLGNANALNYGLDIKGVRRATVSNITLINAGLYIPGDTAYYSAGTQENMVAAQSYSNILIDNSDSTTTAKADVYIGEYLEDIRISDLTVIGDGSSDRCIEMDPPWRNLVFDGVTLKGCSEGFLIDNTSGTEGVGTNSNEGLTIRNVDIWDGGSAFRNADAVISYSVFDNWVRRDADGYMFDFQTNGTYQHNRVSNIYDRFSNAGTNDLIAFRGTTQTVNYNYFSNIHAANTSGKVIEFQAGDSGTGNVASSIFHGRVTAINEAIDLAGSSVELLADGVVCNDSGSLCRYGEGPLAEGSVSFTIEDPQSGDTFLLAPLPTAAELIEMECVVTGGTSLTATLLECNGNGGSCVSSGLAPSCGTTSATDTTPTDADINDGDYLRVDLSSVTGTVPQVAITFRYYKVK